MQTWKRLSLISFGEYASGNYVTRRDVLNFVEREFRKCLTHLWIRSFVARHDDVVYVTTVFSEEKVRLEARRRLLDDYIKLSKEYVRSASNELIFNIYECGFTDWEEQKDEPVMIPAETRTSTVHCPLPGKSANPSRGADLLR
jgi:hypothetical protein